jgi:hypothetical protein
MKLGGSLGNVPQKMKNLNSIYSKRSLFIAFNSLKHYYFGILGSDLTSFDVSKLYDSITDAYVGFKGVAVAGL